MKRDIERLERYYENVPYGEKSRAVEIHGLKNQERINNYVARLVKGHSKAIAEGDKQTASKIQTLIYHIDKEVANAEVMKQEHAAGLRSTSNWADMSFMDEVMLERAEVNFNEDGKMTFTAEDPRTGMMRTETIESMSTNFEEIGDWMQPLMNAKQELLAARKDRGNPPPFDINYFTNNLIKNNWKSIVADKDPTLDPNGPSRGYRLQLMLLEAADQEGNLPDDFNIDKNSFDPTIDDRIFKNISEELKRVFYGSKPNTEEPQTEAQKLMSRLDNK